MMSLGMCLSPHLSQRLSRRHIRPHSPVHHHISVDFADVSESERTTKGARGIPRGLVSILGFDEDATAVEDMLASCMD